MNLNEAIRALITQAQTTGDHLTLSQVARKIEFDGKDEKAFYHKLWRFMSPAHPDTLTSVEAQIIYETLTGKPLLPSSDV